MSYVIGIHMGHSASVAVLENGRPIFCLSEERLARVKMYHRFPSLALEYAINHLHIDPAEVMLLAVDKNDLCKLNGPEQMSLHFKAGLSRNIAEKTIKAKKVLSYFFGVRGVKDQFGREEESQAVLSKGISRYGFRTNRIKSYNHHLSHAASAFWPSPFKEALFVTCDGHGDRLSGLIGMARGDQLEVKHHIGELDSVGQFYAAVTFYLGFKPNLHEGKITGLAAYGDPKCLGPQFLKNVHWNSDGSYEIRISNQYRLTSASDLGGYLNRMTLSIKDRIVLYGENGLNNLMYSANWYSLIAYLKDVCYGETRENVAAGVQYFAEEVCVKFISLNLPEKPVPVVLAGGVYSNVRINQKIREIPGVTNVFVQPAMGDDGLSLGAALLGYLDVDPEAKQTLNAERRPSEISDVYLGPDYSSDIVSACIAEGVALVKLPDIEKKIASWIHGGKIVAYYRGRLEFGPRALGHRSILASATNKNIKDVLNRRLRRTEFMPFAPSILAEHAHEYLLNYCPDHVASEYMTVTYNIAHNLKERIPAVVHVDGTARPQVVHARNDLHYHRIINEYYRLSGIPLVINTSYNIHEEPIVCTPQDAIRTYKANAVDILVMDDFVLGCGL